MSRALPHRVGRDVRGVGRHMSRDWRPEAVVESGTASGTESGLFGFWV